VKDGFLLDTNILSELMKPRPEPRVTVWVAAQDIGMLFLSVVSIGELETGFTTTLDSDRRTRLELALQRHLAILFPGRVLPVTQPIAARWGTLDGMRRLAGRPLGAPDGMIAATALEHDLTLVTRNVKDFDLLGVPVLNPWGAE
jgi:predicted nucleic acid-binding protein